MKTLTHTSQTRSEFDIVNPTHKVLLTAAVFAVVGSFTTFVSSGGLQNLMRAHTTYEQMVAVIEGFNIFVLGGLFSALIPIGVALLYKIFKFEN